MCPRCGVTDSAEHRRGNLHRFYDEIARRIEAGENAPDIADALGISRQRAHQIVNLIQKRPGFNLPRPAPKTPLLRQLDILLAHMQAGRWHDALKMAARWQYLGEQKAAITRAKDALLRPEFYRQLGKDPARLVALGIEALKQRYWKKRGRK